MNDVEMAKRVLVSVGIVLVNADGLMESEDRDARALAFEACVKLTELELALLNRLGMKPQYSDEVDQLDGGAGLR